DHAGHPVSAKLSGLAPGTAYHYRLVAQNASVATPVPGVDRTFDTAAPPTEEPEQPHEEPEQPQQEEEHHTNQPPTATTSTTTTTPTTQSPTPPPYTTPSGESANAPLLALGAPVRSAKHGGTVAGTLEIAAAGAGSRVEIALLAKGSSLGGKG